MYAVDTKLKMQMGASGPAGLPDGTDMLPLVDALATAHADAAQMRIDGGVAIAVLDMHYIAKAILNTSEFHDAISYRANGGASGRALVHALVRTHGLQNRVQAHLETARHP